MSRTFYILTVVTLCGLAAGCVPLPKKSVVHYGMEGRLTDADSGLPISKTNLSVIVDGREFKAKTNRRGQFKVAPEMQHFWTWLGGPMWMDATRATVEISLAGWDPYQRTFIVQSESAEAPVPPDHDRLHRSYIALGSIELKKRE